MNEIEMVKSLLYKMRNGTITQDEYKILQYYLIKNSKEFEGNYPVCTTTISDDEVIFISDTHIGSIYENDSFIDNTYRFAINNNIKTFIHLGDLIEGTSRDYNRSYDSVKKELIRAINFVSWYGLSTKILLGNHDFSIISKRAYPLQQNLIHEFSATSNLFEILGLGKVILDWNGVKIGLNHKIGEKLITFEKSDIVSDIDLLGHAHWYYISENRNAISVPSLSNELKDKTYHDSIALQKYGYKLERNKPYLNFLKARFIDEGVILFQEYIEKDGMLIPNEEIEFNKNEHLIKKLTKKY